MTPLKKVTKHYEGKTNMVKVVIELKEPEEFHTITHHDEEYR